VEAVCAPGRGERIDRCATAAPAGAPALLVRATDVDVLAAGEVFEAVLALAQPLAARASTTNTQSDPARGALDTHIARFAEILGGRRFTHLLMTPFISDPSAMVLGRFWVRRRLA
jgi:hypothetical protein